MKKINQDIRKSTTVIIPSLRDIHHDCVYPQPPFQMEENSKEKV